MQKCFAVMKQRRWLVFSFTKLWALKDFKKILQTVHFFFKQCIFVASGKRIRNNDKLKPIRNVLKSRISIYKWIWSRCMHDSLWTVIYIHSVLPIPGICLQNQEIENKNLRFAVFEFLLKFVMIFFTILLFAFLHITCKMT